ncbi:ammonium transporter family protein [Cucumibacter marinus]|uniref:ammonium transporter n=1 Tax=Cucumibacter marinus TaxID=1121252 RepID=UPI000417F15F|nr:ammonium transporter [Cucumibacter marinus]
MNAKALALKTLPALAIIAFTGSGFAQEAVEPATAVAEAASSGAPAEQTVFILNTLLFLISGFLVMWMAAGFAMLEAGLVRRKNVAMQLLKNISLFAIAGLAYYLIGYKLMYPGDSWMIGYEAQGEDGPYIVGYLGAIGTAVLEAVGVAPEAADDLSYATTGSDFFFQLMFCATTASIVSGTLAERIKLWPFLIFIVVLTGLIYPVQAAWKWGGGFLDTQLGFLDFAGSTVVHSVGGWAALVGAIILGARTGRYNKDGTSTAMPGSSMPLATLGTFILWLGWFGFNGGSQLALGSVGDAADVSRIFANTNMGAAGGAVAALLLTQLIYKKVDLTMVLNGALAGLVSITAEPLTPGLGMAALIGGVGGVIVVFAVPMLDRLKIDDVVGAIPVHLFAGIWGTLAVVITNPDASLFGQVASIVIVGVFVTVTSGIVWLALKATMGIRVSEEEERLGLDKTEVGLEAYPEF